MVPLESCSRNSIGSSMVTMWTGILIGDELHQGRERGRLAAAGGSGDQHQPHRQVAEVEQRLGQLEVVDRLDLVGDHAERRRQRAALEEHVAAVAPEAGNAVAEVHRQVLLELGLVVGLHDGVHHGADVARAQRIAIHRLQPPVQADQRPARRAQMEIRRTQLGHLAQQEVDAAPLCVVGRCDRHSALATVRCPRRGQRPTAGKRDAMIAILRKRGSHVGRKQSRRAAAHGDRSAPVGSPARARLASSL